MQYFSNCSISRKILHYGHQMELTILGNAWKITLCAYYKYCYMGIIQDICENTKTFTNHFNLKIHLLVHELHLTVD